MDARHRVFWRAHVFQSPASDVRDAGEDEGDEDDDDNDDDVAKML